jgi:hypothetical protein
MGKTLNNIGSVYLKQEFEPAMAAYKEACRIMTAKLVGHLMWELLFVILM